MRDTIDYMAFLMTNNPLGVIIGLVLLFGPLILIGWALWKHSSSLAAGSSVLWCGSLVVDFKFSSLLPSILDINPLDARVLGMFVIAVIILGLATSVIAGMELYAARRIKNEPSAAQRTPVA